MRGFVEYKDKRAFMKRASRAIAGRFFLDFPSGKAVLILTG